MRLDGVAVILKSGCGGAFTTSVTVAVWVRLPLAPVMVSVYVPAGVVEEVVTFRVEDPAPLIEAGLKLPEAPVGNPLTLNATLPLKPFCAVVDAV